MITNVYIDGFNMYFVCLKGSPHNWLGDGKLCSVLLPQNEIKHISEFFTVLRGKQAGLRRSGSCVRVCPECALMR